MKKKDKILMAVTLILCVLLFCQRLTGEILHAVFGVALAIIIGVHTWKQKEKMKYKKNAVYTVDCVLLIALAVLIVSGVLAHPLHEVLAVKIIHKLAAVVFVLGIIGHGVQHAKSRKK